MIYLVKNAVFDQSGALKKREGFKVNDLAKRITRILEAVSAQSNDETLWCTGPAIGEAYLTQSLRWLHDVIELDSEEALQKIINQSKDNI